MYQNENIKCKHFDELEIPTKYITSRKTFVNMTQQMKTTDYIWDNTVFEHVVRYTVLFGNPPGFGRRQRVDKRRFIASDG